mmetsp:Transcript_30150/g.72865  ORF Transcript_30150/g.72865 Transcript_30150/m.72865 type:complete len:202 (-) Transcript_30150:363-968(-)
MKRGKRPLSASITTSIVGNSINVFPFSDSINAAFGSNLKYWGAADEHGKRFIKNINAFLGAVENARRRDRVVELPEWTSRCFPSVSNNVDDSEASLSTLSSAGDGDFSTGGLVSCLSRSDELLLFGWWKHSSTFHVIVPFFLLNLVVLDLRLSIPFGIRSKLTPFNSAFLTRGSTLPLFGCVAVLATGLSFVNNSLMIPLP